MWNEYTRGHYGVFTSSDVVKLKTIQRKGNGFVYLLFPQAKNSEKLCELMVNLKNFSDNYTVPPK